MHKLAQTLLVLFMCMVTYANGQIVPALPFQLQNNTLADATQVMANFNQILNNVNANSAKNGSNSDITALLGLTTPLAPGVGGTTTFTGGTSTGSANAQVVASVVPSTFSLTAGSRVVFIAGFTNTNPMTVNVAGSGAKNLLRKTQIGPLLTAGGEVSAGDVVEMVYDGSNFQLIGPPTLVGHYADYTAATIPAGYVLADGSCQSSTGNLAGLFLVIGTTYGSCGGSNFNLPDVRGRVIAGADAGTARLAAAGGCGTGAVTTPCGNQVRTISVLELPNVTWPNTLGISDTTNYTVNNGTNLIQGSTGSSFGGGGVGTGVNVTLTKTGTVSITGSVTSGGSGTPLITVQPTMIGQKLIKY